MLSVDEALALILAQAAPLPPHGLPLADAQGRVLAEDVASDIDSPPYDKSIVDGYAVVAGDLPSMPVERGAATRIMTGAPIPAGADAVVMVERTEHQPHETAHLG